MSDERLKILEMISDGIISASEGADLLAALDKGKSRHEIKAVKNMPFKMLKVKVLSADGDKVNIQIPVNFLKVAKIGNITNKIKVSGMDEGFLNDAIDIDAIIEMIESGAMGEIVNVESADGDIVKIYVE